MKEITEVYVGQIVRFKKNFDNVSGIYAYHKGLEGKTCVVTDVLTTPKNIFMVEGHGWWVCSNYLEGSEFANEED